MKIDFFHIPTHGGEDEVASLNKLLNSVRVLTVDREFVADGANSFWSICVQHQAASQRAAAPGKKPQVDYREVLSAEEFSVFVRLRELRREIASEEAVPVYSVFTNEQLAQMVQRRVKGSAGLEQIDGVGAALVGKQSVRDGSPAFTSGRSHG